MEMGIDQEAFENLTGAAMFQLAIRGIPGLPGECL